MFQFSLCEMFVKYFKFGKLIFNLMNIWTIFNKLLIYALRIDALF
jgi:hypothetical protein